MKNWTLKTIAGVWLLSLSLTLTSCWNNVMRTHEVMEKF